MLAYGFLIFRVQIGILVLDDLAHANLRQLLGHQFLIEQAALDAGLVLHEGRDDFVQVFLTDTRRLLALGLREPLDLDLVRPGLLIDTDIAAAGVVASLTVVKARRRAAVGMLRFELEARREHLLHQQAGRDGLQGIVDGLGYRFLGGIRLGNQVGEPCAGLAGRVAGGAADDLHDLGQAGAIADGERVFAPDPVEAFLRHAQRDDDVHIIPVVLLRRVFERGGHAVALAGIVIDQIGDPQHAACVYTTWGPLDKLEAGRRVDALPLAQRLDDVLDLAHLVLRALARIDIGDVDDGLLCRVEHLEDVIDIRPAVKEVADVELLQVLVAVELLVVGVGDGIELGLILRREHGFGVAPEVGAGHGDDVRLAPREELPEVQAELVVRVA